MKDAKNEVTIDALIPFDNAEFLPLWVYPNPSMYTKIKNSMIIDANVLGNWQDGVFCFANQAVY